MPEASSIFPYRLGVCDLVPVPGLGDVFLYLVSPHLQSS